MQKFKPIFNKHVPVTEQRHLQYALDDVDGHTYLTECLVMLEDEYAAIHQEHLSSTYIGLKDSNAEILQEGLNDVRNSAVKFFKKMIGYLKTLTTKIFTYITAYIGNFDKFITKHRDAIDKAEPDFTLKGYNYTFRADVPNLSVIEKQVDKYSSETGRAEHFTKAEVLATREKYLSDTFFEKTRGEVMGARGQGIERKDYVEITRALYRGEEYSPQNIHVNQTYLRQLTSNYSTLKDMIKKAVSERDKTIVLLENIKTFFEKNPTAHYKDDEKVLYVHRIVVSDDGDNIRHHDHNDVPSTDDRVEVLNMFYNYKLRLFKELGFIVVTAISEKVNAIKESISFTEKVVRKSIFSS
ncbi:hypothetical protein D1872_37620 [compost metagenome]